MPLVSKRNARRELFHDFAIAAIASIALAAVFVAVLVIGS